MIRLEIVENSPLHQGKKELVAYLSGEHLSAAASIKAKCYDCNGYYVDGAFDCKMPNCPLYAYNPYNRGRQKKKRAVSQNVLDALKRGRKAKEKHSSGQI